MTSRPTTRRYEDETDSIHTATTNNNNNNNPAASLLLQPILNRLTKMPSEQSYASRAQMSTRRYVADQCVTVVVCCVLLVAVCLYLLSCSEDMMTFVQTTLANMLLQDSRNKSSNTTTTL